MTGPEHYREAEERMRASDWQRQEGDVEGSMHEAAMAQVHATLALAAAAAYPAVKDYLGDEAVDPRAWTEVLS